MTYLDLAKKRYSVRDYLPTRVEDEKIATIVEAGRVAPTAANLQPVKLVILDTEEKLSKVSRGANLYGAPLAIVVCADHAQAWQRPFDEKRTTDIDATIVTDHMMMEATDLGLGSVWICYFDPSVIAKELDLSEGLEPINILAIGYSNESAASPERHATERKSTNELII